MARELRLDAELGGDKAVKAGLHGMAKGIDEVGDQAAQSERQLSRLSAEITKTEAKMALLTKQFNQTGDSAFVKEFGKERKSIAGLRAMQKELDRTEQSGRKARKALDGLVPGGKGSGISGQLRIPGLDLLKAIGPGGLASGGLPLFAGASGLVAAGGLLTAGVGTAAGGIALAASQRKDVQAAFSGMAKSVFRDLSADVDVFAEPLIRSARSFGEAWRQEGPLISGALRDASRYVEPLTDGVRGLVHEFLPGFTKAVKSAGPVIKSLSENFLPDVGKGLGNLFESISGAAPGAAAALRDLGTAAKSLLTGTGAIIEGGSALYKLLRDLDTFGGRVPSTLERASLGIEAIAEGWHTILSGESPGGPGFGHSAALVRREIDLTRDSVGDLGAALSGLTDKFNDIFDVQIDNKRAQIEWQRGLDEVTETIKGNKKTLDINTKAGQENADVILRQIELAKNMRDERIKLAGGENANASAIRDANTAYEAQVQAIAILAIKLGLMPGMVEDLIGSLRNIPSDIPINIRLQLKGFSPDDIREAARARLPSGVPVTVTGSGTNRRLQFFDSGGWVQGTPGSPQLAVVHAGEYVVPRTDIGASGRGVDYAMPRASVGSSGSGPANLTLQHTGTSTSLEGLLFSILQEGLRTGRFVIKQQHVQA